MGDEFEQDISCQKYVFQQNEYNLSPISELSVKYASEICHENTNTPLDGAYLADFGIDINLTLILLTTMGGWLLDRRWFWA